MRPEKALHDVAQIRSRLQLIDASRTFRCWSIAISATIFGVAALVQNQTGMVSSSPISFARYWFLVAAGCSAMIISEIWIRSTNTESRITLDWIRQIVSALTPSAAAILLGTWAFLGTAETTGMLPGLWAILAAVGVAGCGRLLPGICQLAAIWLVLGGAISIRFADATTVTPSVSMVLLFSVGQLIFATCLYVGARSDD